MVKKRILLGAISVLLFNTVYSQKDTSTKNGIFIIKTDLGFLASNFIGGYHGAKLTLEKGFSGRHSLQLTVGYLGYDNTSRQNWRIMPDYKYFINKNSFKGMYTGGYAKFVFDKQRFESGYGENEYHTVKYLNYAGGAIVGFQTYFKKHLTLDFLVGVGLAYATRQTTQTTGTPPDKLYFLNDRTYPSIVADGRVSINLGYKF